MLQAFVLGKLLRHFDLELVFHSFFLIQTLGLELELVVLGRLQFLFLSESFFGLSSFGCSGSFFLLLNLQIVSHIFNVFILGSSGGLLGGQLLEDSVSLGLGGCLHCLELITPLLLLAVEFLDQLVFVLLQLSLALEEGIFFVDG